MLTDSLSELLDHIVGFIPTLIVFVVVILLYKVTQKLMTKKVESGTKNTFFRQVILFVIVFIGFFMVLLALPIGEVYKKEILTLLGIVLAASISLSSTTFLGNAAASLNLSLVNAFKVGDFIRCHDTFGRVTTKGLFHTQIQTEDRDFMTLPNLYLSTNPIKVIRSSGTIVTAEVSLGYDVPRVKVENVLIKAIGSIGLSDPFVFITSLGDFSITYKAHGLLTDVNHLLSYRSNLLEAMIDHLHDADVEIVSPTFMNQRQVTDQVFLSKSNVHHAIHDTSKAEKVIFDKAEKAGKIEEKQQAVNELNEEIRSLEEEKKSVDDKESLQQEIDRLTNQKDRLQKAVDEARHKLKNEE